MTKTAYEQTIWERDIAIRQLNELGFNFGEKVTGEWKDGVCSNCGYEVLYAQYKQYMVLSKHCPYCGRIMAY